MRRDLGRGLIDSWFVRGIEFVTNLVLLSILVIVASLPVITIVSAVAAGFGVVRDWTRSGEPAVIRPFVRHFRLNVTKGLALTLPYAVLITLVWLDLRLVTELQPVALRLPAFCVSVAGGLALISIAVALLPVLVHYDADLVAGVRHAVTVVLAHPLAALAPVVIIYGTIGLALIVPISPLLTVGLSIYGVHRVWSSIFAKDDAAVISEASDAP